jgi:protein-S-isoprenylcysteine O-methyltransferase Ste14
MPIVRVKGSIPQWMARLGLLLVFVVAIPIGHGVAPWALSRLAARHGGGGGSLAAWNLVGLAPIAFGAGLLVWVAVVGWRNVPGRVELGSTGNYLVTAGPYRLTRNPMYVGELSLWFGWAILFGSLAIALGFLALAVILQWLIVPWEERSLRRRLGERYRMYAAKTPRWFGRAS